MLKEFCRVATRREKLKVTFMGLLHLVVRFIRHRFINNVNSAYKTGANFKVRHDEQLVRDVQLAVGSDIVRMIGHRRTVASASGRPHLRITEASPSAYACRFNDTSRDDHLD